MNLVERYIFKRMMGTFAVAFPALALTVWLSQALPQLSRFSDAGQNIILFLQITGLLFPSLVLMIAPITVQMAVTFVINGMNSDSEMVAINAAGARRWVVLKPVLLLCLVAALLTAACSIWLGPYTMGLGRTIGTAAGANIVGSVLRAGKFRQLGSGVTVFVTDRDFDGTIHGLFVVDPRHEGQSLTYVAKTGKLVENDAGKFLFLQNGMMQRQDIKTGNLTSIEFQSYVFDLATLAGAGSISDYYPQEQPVTYLLNPDPKDPYYRQNPNAFAAELHIRLSAPLFVFAFGLIPLAILGRPRTNRQGTTLASAGGWCLALSLRGAGLVVAGTLPYAPELTAWAYILPAIGMAVPLWFILGDRRIPLPRLLGRRGAGSAAPAPAATRA